VGFISLPGRRRLYLGAALAGQLVGIREEDDGRWQVSFLELHLGHFEPCSNTFKPAASPPSEGI
jgi:hypothetical protein